MATPLSADALLRALRAEGLRVVEHRDWRTHNRNHKGSWGPVHGVMIHHTVTEGTQSSVELCYNGHSSLPGPLCHGVIAKDGTVYMVGNGRTNHAGSGDDDVLRAVIDERDLPADNEANTDGNRHFYGFECINLGDGKDPWPAAQLAAIEKAAAAICRAHGWSQRSVIGHLEWQPGKVDPRGFGMDWMRGLIRDRLAGDTTPAPTAPSEEDDDMALSDDDKKWIRDLVTTVVRAEVGRATAAWKNPDIDPRDIFQIQRDAANYSKQAADQTKDLALGGITDEQTAALANAVAAHPTLAATLAKATADELHNRTAD